MQLELNSKWIQIEYTEWSLKSTIGLRFNWIEFKFHRKEMRCKLVGKILKIFPWIWCWIVINKKKNPQRKFIEQYIWEYIKQIPILALFNLQQQFMKPQSILPKPTLMNHCHLELFSNLLKFWRIIPQKCPKSLQLNCDLFEIGA